MMAVAVMEAVAELTATVEVALSLRSPLPWFFPRRQIHFHPHTPSLFGVARWGQKDTATGGGRQEGMEGT